MERGWMTIIEVMKSELFFIYNKIKDICEKYDVKQDEFNEIQKKKCSMEARLNLMEGVIDDDVCKILKVISDIKSKCKNEDEDDCK